MSKFTIVDSLSLLWVSYRTLRIKHPHTRLSGRWTVPVWCLRASRRGRMRRRMRFAATWRTSESTALPTCRTLPKPTPGCQQPHSKGAFSALYCRQKVHWQKCLRALQNFELGLKAFQRPFRFVLNPATRNCRFKPQAIFQDREDSEFSSKDLAPACGIHIIPAILAGIATCCNPDARDLSRGCMSHLLNHIPGLAQVLQLN